MTRTQRAEQIRLVHRDFVSGWLRSTDAALWDLRWLGVSKPRAEALVGQWKTERSRARRHELHLRRVV